ncbi:sulfurtransferase [Erythrobacter alti]|uniref:sulfurtransferase n=1 Tax=Erythrobacter alti TaxID=1896145 RepID=UPI0030F41D78
MEPLVSTRWLADALGSPDLAVLDASAHLPGAERDARAEFAEAHIPGGQFFDLKSLTNPDSDVPSALPTRIQLEDRLGALGVASSDRIVLYDNSALRSSARAWFMFDLYGWKNVALLDGGLQKWIAEKRPVESGAETAEARNQTVPVQPSVIVMGDNEGRVRCKAEMLANIDANAEQVVDARDAARFRGDAPDIRSGVAAGHIPGSCNLPFGIVLNEDGTFKGDADIRAAFADAGVDLDQPIVTTCGSGITASVLLFALHLIGKSGALYDGSWSEWGSDPSLPVATGEPA